MQPETYRSILDYPVWMTNLASWEEAKNQRPKTLGVRRANAFVVSNLHSNIKSLYGEKCMEINPNRRKALFRCKRIRGCWNEEGAARTRERKIKTQVTYTYLHLKIKFEPHVIRERQRDVSYYTELQVPKKDGNYSSKVYDQRVRQICIKKTKIRSWWDVEIFVGKDEDSFFLNKRKSRKIQRTRHLFEFQKWTACGSKKCRLGAAISGPEQKRVHRNVHEKWRRIGATWQSESKREKRRRRNFC